MFGKQLYQPLVKDIRKLVTTFVLLLLFTKLAFKFINYEIKDEYGTYESSRISLTHVLQIFNLQKCIFLSGRQCLAADILFKEMHLFHYTIFV